MNNILIDTCFWYALYDVRDPDHKKANELVEFLDMGNLILPFPTLYETINTRFSNNKGWLEDFEKVLKNENVKIIEDNKYKENALFMTVDLTLNRNRPLSLVDMIIRLMIEDTNLKVDYVISFNTRDFIDLCHKHRIELIND